MQDSLDEKKDTDLKSAATGADQGTVQEAAALESQAVEILEKADALRAQDSADKKEVAQDKDNAAAPEDKAATQAAASTKPEAPAPAQQPSPAPAASTMQTGAAPVADAAVSAQIEKLKGRSSFLSFCCLILAAVVIGGGVYCYQQINALKSAQLAGQQDAQALAQAQQSLTGAQAEIADLLAANDSLKDQNQALAQGQGELNAKLEAISVQHQDELKAMGELNARLDKFEARDPNEWRIAESYFNVAEAYRQAVFGRNAAAAIWNLNQADRLLINLEDENIIAIRAAIAKDLSTLSAIKQPDLTGITLRLEQLYADAGALVLAGYSDPEKRAHAFDKSSEPTSSFADWKQNLLTSAKEFSSRFVEIRRRAPDAVTEFLSPQQDLFLREHIKTRLLLSRIAAAQGEQNNYTDNLKEARRLIDSYFDKESALVQAALNSIDQLLTTDVSVTMPRVLESHQLFEKLAARQVQGIQG